VPGGAYRNREYLSGSTIILPGVGQALSDILFDPQTSGGLLISLPPAQARRLLEDVQPHCPQARIIGMVEEPGEGLVIIE
jgi:selenide,water dikinase